MAEVIPFTLVLILLPSIDSALELIMFTPDPVTPFTVVVNELADELLDTEFTAVVVEVTPFTLEVITLPPLVTVLEEITEDVAVTPLIVVVKVLPTRD